MKVYEGLSNLPFIPNPVVTSGTFDGVHLGHQKILSRIEQNARQIGGETVLITFWPHPRLILYPYQHNLRLLSSFEEKVELLEQFGVDHLITIPFTHEFSQMSSQDFIENILVQKIKTKKLIIGYDHKFGKNREGSFDYLQSHSDQFSFEMEEISRQEIDAIGISSTKIRKALEEGDLETASGHLGRAYELTGLVVKGKQIGRSIGFPTANIQVQNDYKLIPKEGVYGVEVEVDGVYFLGMLNIGSRPTVDGNQQSIEAHLFDFEGDLYDKKLKVKFKYFLREEQKFENLAALKAQLIVDRSTVKVRFDLTK